MPCNALRSLHAVRIFTIRWPVALAVLADTPSIWVHLLTEVNQILQIFLLSFTLYAHPQEAPLSRY